MKTFKLNFAHPVKGWIKFVCPNEKLCRSVCLDTKDSHILEISLNGFPKGRWRVLLEWEFDGKDYFREEEIDIL